MPIHLIALLTLAVIGAIGMLLTAAVILEHLVYVCGKIERRTPYGHRWDLRHWQQIGRASCRERV